MASDDDYMKFLGQANEKSEPVLASANDGSRTSSLPSISAASSARLPKALQGFVEGSGRVHLTSDTDYPFEGIAIEYAEKHMPDARTFATLLANIKAEDVQVEKMEMFDPRDQYIEMIDTLAHYTDGGRSELRAYRVGMEASRVAYYLLGKEKVGTQLIGFCALSVES